MRKKAGLERSQGEHFRRKKQGLREVKESILGEKSRALKKSRRAF